MNSREIVQRTLSYSGPERLAASFPAPYWNDFLQTNYWLQGYDPQWRDVGPERQQYVDEWGNTWARLDRSSKGEVARGALVSWDQLDGLVLPDLANRDNFAGVVDACRQDAGQRYVIGHLPGFPFNLVRKLRRLDQFFMDILLEPERVRALLQRVQDLLAQTIVAYAESGVDAVMFPEDWGTQISLMIRPATWRDMFMPGFVELCQTAHTRDVRVFMHSCGKITDIIPDLIKAGIDVLQFDQPRLHGIDVLARFHGQVTFWCPVDIQQTLQSGDPRAIEDEAREMIARLGGPEGGLIGGYYSDNASIGLDPSVQDIACRAFMRYGDYQQA
jgi:uroporphyrinogen decarboxylase